jgi:hypothetical protein
LLFPAAVKALRSEHRAEIDGRLDGRKDPLSKGVVEERFQNLQKTILRWERDTKQSQSRLRNGAGFSPEDEHGIRRCRRPGGGPMRPARWQASAGI